MHARESHALRRRTACTGHQRGQLHRRPRAPRPTPGRSVLCRLPRRIARRFAPKHAHTSTCNHMSMHMQPLPKAQQLTRFLAPCMSPPSRLTPLSNKQPSDEQQLVQPIQQNTSINKHYTVDTRRHPHFTSATYLTRHLSAVQLHRPHGMHPDFRFQTCIRSFAA